MNVIECLDDPMLFANHFRGGTWGPWRTCLKALFGLPLDEAEAELYRACTGRAEAPAEPFKEAALVVGRRGGKALATDTPLPTPTGWTTMGKVTAGDEVYDEIGRPCRVLVAHPVMIGRPCYRVCFSDGSEIVADEDHLWTTLDKRARKALGRPSTAAARAEKTITTAELRRTLHYQRSDGRPELNHAIPCCGALLGKPVDLPIDAYLLGLWLGDGHSKAAAITTPDPEVVAAFEAAGFTVNKWRAEDGGLASTYGITYPEGRFWEEKGKFASGGSRFGSISTGETFGGKLKIAGVWGNKHIPPAYLRAPATVRLALLQGLMDSDGYCDVWGHAEYTSIRLELARGVRELAVSLGMKAGFSTERAMLEGRDCGPKYRVTFIPDLAVFRLPRKVCRQRVPGRRSEQCNRRYVTAVEPVASVPVRCITVDSPSELFLAGETMIPTHNSRTLALIAVYLACFRDYTPYLAPGEVATVAVIASDRKQARSIFRFTIGLLRAVPMLAALIQEDSAEAIVLNNRVVIEIHTASFRVTRGYTFAAVLADETAFWRDENSANPDIEIFRALRPGMSSIPGAILMNASSPYRRAGLLWTTFQRNYGRDDARVLVWKADTATMNPRVDPAIIAEAYEDDPESAASEYGGEFRTDIADFVSRTIVEACIEPGCHERPPARAAGSYRAFIDAAGGSGSDSMTLAISHLDGSGTDRIPVLDAVRERKPPFSPDDVVQEFSLLMKSYGVSRATSDKWGGDWVIEAFRKHNITVEPHADPKSDIYRELLPLLNARRCSLLDNPRLISQLCGLERRVARGGRDSIDHSPGGHDDLANAAAGALLLANVHRPMKINAESLRKLLNSPPMPGSPNYGRRGPDHGWRVA